MQPNHPLKKARRYYLLVIAAVFLVLLLLNWEAVQAFAQSFDIPFSIVIFVCGVTISLLFGIQLGKELALPQVSSQDQDQDVPEAVAVVPEQNAASFDVSGDTFARIGLAIAEFPVKYPDYKTISPKLDADIRPWLKESGITKNDRESHVFSAIISEHYEI
jgi:hypothetical protein